MLQVGGMVVVVVVVVPGKQGGGKNRGDWNGRKDGRLPLGN